jgi:PhnB protein
MQMSPYLHFNGNCEAAFKFYEKALGAKIESMFRFQDAPAAEQVPAEWRSKVMHAGLTVGSQLLMGSDVPPDRYQKPQGFSVSLAIKEVADAERIFGALAENATVTMPLQQTFWAVRFGMLIDQYGIPWMINCGPDS